MTKSQFKPGDRVRISEAYHWAQGATGTVALPPAGVVQMSAGESWQGCWRHVRGAKRFLTFYWIAFDEPHDDDSGDGPYSAGEIDADYLSLAH